MGVYIKGTEMPKKGHFTVIDSTGQVWTTDWPTREYFRNDKAKAVPVPPHGDLIERDKLREIMFIGEQCLYSWDEIEDAIDFAPTIIPAEEEKADV